MDLIASLKQDEKAAMEIIYHTYWEQVFDTAFRRVSDEAIAQDITQDIFISLWEKRHSLEIQESAPMATITELTL